MTDEGQGQSPPREPGTPPPPPPPAPPPGWQQPPWGWQQPPYGWHQPQPGGWPPPGQYPPGYGYPPPGYSYPPPPLPQPQGPPPPQTDATAIIALSLAIGSFMLWFIGPILAIVALVLASTGERKIKESGGRLEGEGLAQAARIVAWVNLGITALVLLIIVVAAIIGAAVEDDANEFGLLVRALQLLR